MKTDFLKLVRVGSLPEGAFFYDNDIDERHSGYYCKKRVYNPSDSSERLTFWCFDVINERDVLYDALELVYVPDYNS